MTDPKFGQRLPHLEAHLPHFNHELPVATGVDDQFPRTMIAHTSLPPPDTSIDTSLESLQERLLALNWFQQTMGCGASGRSGIVDIDTKCGSAP